MDSNIEYNRRAQKERLRKREENFKGKFYVDQNILRWLFKNFSYRK